MHIQFTVNFIRHIKIPHNGTYIINLILVDIKRTTKNPELENPSALCLAGRT